MTEQRWKEVDFDTAYQLNKDGCVVQNRAPSSPDWATVDLRNLYYAKTLDDFPMTKEYFGITYRWRVAVE